jgi:diguanylate cyclase (GGDEF)-like protein
LNRHRLNCRTASEKIGIAKLILRARFIQHGLNPRIRSSLATLLELLRVPTDKPELLRAQLRALSRLVPLLYFVMIVNTLALAYTYYGVAPSYLTVGFPFVVTIFYSVRGWVWAKVGYQPISDASTGRLLKTMVVAAPAASAVLLVWALALFSYGDAYAQGHVVFCLSITVMACIFCLLYLRPAALLMTGVLVIPFTIFLLATGRPVFVAIALSMLLVSGAMVYILLVSSRDFARMIAFQKQLAETHAAEIATQRDSLGQAERSQVALNNMLQGLCMFDKDDRLIVCNKRYAMMYSLPAELTRPGALWRDIVAYRTENVGFRDLNHDDVIAQRRDLDLRSNETTVTWRLADGRTILVRHQPITEGGWVSIHEDVTEKCVAEERLSHMARHDALTGLPNKMSLLERMEQEAEGQERDHELALLSLELNQIKETSDALGHGVGDGLLREVASRLKTCVGAADAVARLGGAEFAILHIGTPETDELANLAQHILDVLTKGYEIEGHQINICATIGIARAPRDETAGSALLRLADIALYRAKSDRGGSSYRFFEAAMDRELQSRRRLESDLRRALAAEEFEVYYQPINDAKTRSIRSFEALVRWRHPERGMVSPGEFIPLAEETGLIIPLGEWVLRTACREATRWPFDVGVSVNLSAHQFGASDLPKIVHEAITDTGLAVHRLELEVTESVLLHGSSDNLAILRELLGLGVKIALDDFGTGYSSLSYLRSFPFDKLKIDQSFIRNIDQRDSSEIVKAIAGLGQTLGMTTTAEGVETEQQLKTVIAYGCVEVQGYLFSRPVPAEGVEGVLAKFHGTRRVATGGPRMTLEEVERILV